MLKPLLLAHLIVALVIADKYDRLYENGLQDIPDDAKLTPRELANKYDYPFEDHYAETEDGYILNLWRIKHGAKGSGTNSHPVVLNHGLLACGHTFMSNHPHLALAFVLADSGYDVWLANNRGNTFSRNSTKLNPNKKDFWDFDFEDMAVYDIPANLKYIARTTGVQKVPYIGHSQGTAIMFVALSRIQDKIAENCLCYGALAPATSVGHVTSTVLKTVAKLHLEVALKFLGVYEILPRIWLVSETAEWICGDFKMLCEDVLWLLFDAIPGVDDTDRTAVSYAYYPAGTSLKNLEHWEQEVNSGNFQSFDYGKKENQKVYGQATPPLYDLTKMSKVPIGMFTGTQDELADPTDVAWLKTQIPEQVVIYNVNYENFGHSTFNIGKEEEVLPFLEDVKKFLNMCHDDDAEVQ